eukprot:7359361-Pyramimonas_sp.AAC.1
MVQVWFMRDSNGVHELHHRETQQHDWSLEARVCGSGVVQACFKHGSSVVQVKLRTLYHRETQQHDCSIAVRVWFRHGSNMVQVWFKSCTIEGRNNMTDHQQCACGSGVVQVWFSSEVVSSSGATTWLTTSSARAWFKYGSSVVQVWFKCSSGVVPSSAATT